MNNSAKGSTGLLLFCCVMISGCSKTLTHFTAGSSGSTKNAGAAYFTTDPAKSPFYGDSILYLKSSGPSAYLFPPVNKLGTGKYVSWPAGLSVDAQTGVIDASQSEPGSRYNIGFIDGMTNDTAYSQVILSGLTYQDGIYYMDSPDPAVLEPFYNANAIAPWIGNSSAGKNQGSPGLFDEQGPSGLRAIDQQLVVDASNGAIDLKNSLRQGLFGPHPQNGDTKKIAVYYRLNDNSNMSLQKTSLILHYYNTLSDVPTDLISICQTASNAFPPALTAGGTNSDYAGQKSVTARVVPVKGAALVPPSKPAPVAPRPPQIVIVNVGHR